MENSDGAGLRQRFKATTKSDMVPRIMAPLENGDPGKESDALELKDLSSTTNAVGSSPLELNHITHLVPVADTNIDADDESSCDDTNRLLLPDQALDDGNVIFQDVAGLSLSVPSSEVII
ncbi:hypothetical protein Btru_058164 [Bulinus truncatus]|nr:hypothetical protein Btru_058164 [Bulinus truncatus]